MKLIQFFKERTEEEIVEKFVNDFSKRGFNPGYLWRLDISECELCNPNCKYLDCNSDYDSFYCSMDNRECPFQKERNKVFENIIREFLNGEIEIE